MLELRFYETLRLGQNSKYFPISFCSNLIVGLCFSIYFSDTYLVFIFPTQIFHAFGMTSVYLI